MNNVLIKYKQFLLDNIQQPNKEQDSLSIKKTILKNKYIIHNNNLELKTIIDENGIPIIKYHCSEIITVKNGFLLKRNPSFFILVDENGNIIDKYTKVNYKYNYNKICILLRKDKYKWVIYLNDKVIFQNSPKKEIIIPYNIENIIKTNDGIYNSNEELLYKFNKKIPYSNVEILTQKFIKIDNTYINIINNKQFILENNQKLIAKYKETIITNNLTHKLYVNDKIFKINYIDM